MFLSWNQSYAGAMEREQESFGTMTKISGSLMYSTEVQHLIPASLDSAKPAPRRLSASDCYKLIFTM